MLDAGFKTFSRINNKSHPSNVDTGIKPFSGDDEEYF